MIRNKAMAMIKWGKKGYDLSWNIKSGDVFFSFHQPKDSG